MAGKKDKAVVAVISGLTANQSAQITKEIMRAKEKYAPQSNDCIRCIVQRGSSPSKRSEKDRR